MERYTYPSLPSLTSIRVLYLESGGGDKLYGSLKIVSIEDNVPYEALSYVWGDPTRSHTIQIQPNYSLSITSNLYHALCNLRHTEAWKAPRLLWIDGVCINQEDLDERARQVRMMATIYAKAHRVITYVGEDTCNFNSALDLAEKLICCAKKVKSAGSTSSLSEFEPGRGFRTNGDGSWDSLSDFLSRTWYTRKWILQESVVNHNSVIMCGRQCTAWEFFVRLARALHRLGRCVADGQLLKSASMEAMLSMVFMRSNFLGKVGPEPVPFFIALNISRGFKATNPRHCVFAVASLVNDVEIDIDYTKSPQQVFIEATVKMLKGDSDSHLFVLSLVGLHRKLGELPSWVPDWSVSLGDCNPVVSAMKTESPFNCGGNAEARPEVSVQDGSLTVPGIRKGHIVNLTDPLRHNLMRNSWVRYRWAQEQFKRLSKLGVYATGISYMEAFWRTMISNLDVGNVKQSIAPNAYMHGFEAFIRPLAPNPCLVKSKEDLLAADYGDDHVYRSWGDNAYFYSGKSDYIPEDTFGELRGVSADQEAELGDKY
ncbi:hypothetical protein M434DRAFT_12109 [Hypoxylon sp. CO27-5]|nr:hypothetical protein M434DRAFT_12109 [Hypoxylon sp. CO27-5]